MRIAFCKVKYINVTFDYEKINPMPESENGGKTLKDSNYEEDKKDKQKEKLKH